MSNNSSNVLRKIYKGHELEFRPHKTTPGLYIGFKQDGEAFEENCPGWGWTFAAFFDDQLEKLPDWSL